MNFTDVFHDYIQDIPMDIGRKFFPTPNIVIENIYLPTSLTLANLDYSFEAETRAREMFDRQDDPITTSSTTIENSVKSSSSTVISDTWRFEKPNPNGFPSLTQEVLVPRPVVANPPPSVLSNQSLVATPNSATIHHSFQDFEQQNNVFDDLELLALDEKKALREILMSSSSQSSTSSINNNVLEKKSISPQFVATPPQTPILSQKKPREKTSKEEELKRRLLEKGFRSDIVEAALNKLPRARFVHIEYYMKACRTMEKTGKVTIDEALDFLIKPNLMDKQMILNYSESSAHLLCLGFPKKDAFQTVDSVKGDRIKSIERYNAIKGV